MCVCVCVCVSLASGLQQFEDGNLDAVLFSMGRTMTQEEVCQLMQRTVQQVSLISCNSAVSLVF